MVAQLLGVGTIAPLFYFLHYTFSLPAEKMLRLPASSITPVHPGTILTLVFLTTHLPTTLMYISPQAQTRHYWTWVWQMYPVWFYVIHLILSNLSSQHERLALRTARLSIPLSLVAASSAIVWLHLLSSCPFPIHSVLFPGLATQQTLGPSLRRLFHVDELCAILATFIWFALEFLDIWQTKKELISNAQLPIPFQVIVAIVAFCLLGPGATFLGLWAWRENILSRGPNA